MNEEVHDIMVRAHHRITEAIRGQDRRQPHAMGLYVHVYAEAVLEVEERTGIALTGGE